MAAGAQVAAGWLRSMHMKTFVTVICISQLLAVAGRADDLDDLLGGRSTADVSPVMESASSGISDAQLDKPSGYSDPHDLHTAITASVAENKVLHSTSAAEHHGDDTESVSLVPEPSAVALAVGALVYFLLFGRRRSLA